MCHKEILQTYVTRSDRYGSIAIPLTLLGTTLLIKRYEFQNSSMVFQRLKYYLYLDSRLKCHW